MGFFYANELHTLDDGKTTFDLEFIKISGEVRQVKNCLCTSFHSRGLTINIKYPGNKQPIKIRRCQIQKINGKKFIL